MMTSRPMGSGKGATTMFLFAIPAGALGDVVDRRKPGWSPARRKLQGNSTAHTPVLVGAPPLIDTTGLSPSNLSKRVINRSQFERARASAMLPWVRTAASRGRTDG